MLCFALVKILLGKNRHFQFFLTLNKFLSMAAECKRETVVVPSDSKNGNLPGVLFGNPSASPRGLIVNHEWWGMNQQVQDEGAEIARDGNLTVLVVDHYRGKVAKDREDAGHYMGGLDWDGAVKDLNAAAKYLKSIGCRKVGVTGFCMGGALSLAAAARAPEISAAAPFYGIPRQDGFDLTTIRIPVQGHFGELDEVSGFSSPADYNALNEKLKAAGVPFELFTYNAGHGFTNINNPNYSKEATTLAFSRLYKFMEEKL